MSSNLLSLLLPQLLLCFDLTYKRSFEIIKNPEYEDVLRNIKKYAPKNVTIFLIGTKCDLVHQREISREEAEAFAKANGMGYFETSAKENINIEEAFFHLARQISIDIAE